jgi:hypothetical protein
MKPDNCRTMNQFLFTIFSLVWMGSVFSQNSNQELSQMKELLQEISINAIELPSDYKAFMQITNGFLFASGVDPSFCILGTRRNSLP